MDAEASPLLNHLKLTLIESKLKGHSCVIYQGQYNKCTITVVTNGKDAKTGVDNVGTSPAAVATFIAINEFNPDIIINAGTAGGFKRYGAAIGDVFIGSVHRHHDRRIPLPGNWDEYGRGNHEGIKCENLIKTLGYKTGVVTSSNSLDHTETDDVIMAKNEASVKDMEAAAIGWVAETAKVPFLTVKVVTDIVDGDRITSEEFLENLGTAANSLQTNLPRVIDFITGKQLSEL